MTQLLVSVRSSAEAAAALEGGADWIDLKEPAEGALGAVSNRVAQEVVRLVAGKAPVSAACGELIDWQDPEQPPPCLAPGVDIAKIGLAGCRDIQWQSRWMTISRTLRRQRRHLVAVAYVDEAAAKAPSLDEVVALASGVSAYVLFDTFNKAAGSILEHWSIDRLGAVLESASAAGLKSVIGGSVIPAHIRRLPMGLIDLIGVRGAACEGGRNGAVCATRVGTMRAAIDAGNLALIESAVFPACGEIA